jgi:hypothetical protein
MDDGLLADVAHHCSCPVFSSLGCYLAVMCMRCACARRPQILSGTQGNSHNQLQLPDLCPVQYHLASTPLANCSSSNCSEHSRSWLLFASQVHMTHFGPNSAKLGPNSRAAGHEGAASWATGTTIADYCEDLRAVTGYCGLYHGPGLLRMNFRAVRSSPKTAMQSPGQIHESFPSTWLVTDPSLSQASVL